MAQCPRDKRMRVAIDAGPAVHQKAGLSRYAERLIVHLRQRQSHQLDLLLFYNAHSGHSLPPSLVGAPHATLSMGQVAWRLSVLASQLVAVPRFEGHLPSSHIYHATEHLLPRLARPTVLTVHDLIFERVPQYHTWANRAFLTLGMPLFIQAADAVIAVSHRTRQDLMERYGVPASKITVIYQGIDDRFAPVGPPAVRAVQERFSPGRPYLLMVGTLEPRKNHRAALQALARLKAAGFPHSLLIAGATGWMFAPVRRLVDELSLAQDVRFIGYVADDELPALYAGAECLLLPSMYEGFGFPALEAMACHTPVVCSDAGSLPEVVGAAALMVAPQDVAALTAAIRRVIEEPGCADTLRRAGLARAATFRWQKCAAETVALYRSL